MYYFFCIKKNMHLACAHWSHTKNPENRKLSGLYRQQRFRELTPI